MINHFSTILKLHKDLTEAELCKIINLKMQHWNYPPDSQRKWINENLSNDDMHLWLEMENEDIIAYLNIVYVDVEIDNKIQQFLGIGNVCVDKKYLGSGFGLLLMHTAQYYINNFKKNAVLLCKNHLINFYKKAGWHVYEGNKIFNKNIFNDVVMFKEYVECNEVKMYRTF